MRLQHMFEIGLEESSCNQLHQIVCSSTAALLPRGFTVMICSSSPVLWHTPSAPLSGSRAFQL